MATSVEYLFKQISNSLDEFIEGNNSYYTFRDEVNKSEDSRYSVSRRYINRNIDLTWVDRIEDCVIPLDTILRAPRNFIKDVEEIVPIAMTRKITSESVKHLATHTNLIQSVEDDKVTPNKILNVYKEESFATYENRFIKTLLKHLDLFIEKRYQGLLSQKDVDNVTAARCDQSFDLGGEHIKYQMEISVHLPSEVSEEGLKSETKSSMANDIERVMKIRTIIRDFMNSNFMSLLSDAPDVHPPITKTNLLTKNVDYKKALELWQFIESYAENGYQVDLVDNSNNAQLEYQEKMNQMAFIEYLFLKKYTGQDVDDKIRAALEQQLRSLGKEDELRGGEAPQGKFSEESRGAVRKEFRSILGNYQDNLDEVKNIFVQEFERQQRAIKKEEKRLVDAIRRIIAKQKLIEEKERQKRLEEERKAKLREEKLRKKEEEKKRKAEEKAKRDEERRLKKEEEARRKAEEKARLAEEKAKREAEAKRKAEEEKAKKPDINKFEAARLAVEKAIGKANGENPSNENEDNKRAEESKPKKERKSRAKKEETPVDNTEETKPTENLDNNPENESSNDDNSDNNTPTDVTPDESQESQDDSSKEETPEAPTQEPVQEAQEEEPQTEETPVEEAEPESTPVTDSSENTESEPTSDVDTPVVATEPTEDSQEPVEETSEPEAEPVQEETSEEESSQEESTPDAETNAPTDEAQPVEESSDESTGNEKDSKPEEELKPTPRVPLMKPNPKPLHKVKSSDANKDKDNNETLVKASMPKDINNASKDKSKANRGHKEVLPDKFKLARKAVRKAVKDTNERTKREHENKN